MMQQLLDFFDACYPFGYPLLACSVFLIAAAVYHILLNARAGSSVSRLRRLWQAALDGDAGAKTHLLALASRRKSVAARLIALIAAKPRLDDSALRQIVEARAKEEFVSLQAGLPAIDTIVNIAPMFGILGTAWGLVEIFGVFGLGEHQEGIAQGIATALYTTIFGLAIATPGVILASYFARRLERRAASLETLMNEIIAHRSVLAGSPAPAPASSGTAPEQSA